MLRILVVAATAAVATGAALLLDRDLASWRDALCTQASTAHPPVETAAAVNLTPPAVDAPDFVPLMRQKLVLLATELEVARRSGGLERRPLAEGTPGAETGPFSHAYAYFGRACDGLWRLGSVTAEDEARQLRIDVVCSYRAVLRVLEVAAARDVCSPDIAETDQPAHDTAAPPNTPEGQTETAAAGS